MQAEPIRHNPASFRQMTVGKRTHASTQDAVNAVNAVAAPASGAGFAIRLQ